MLLFAGWWSQQKKNYYRRQLIPQRCPPTYTCVSWLKHNPHTSCRNIYNNKVFGLAESSVGNSRLNSKIRVSSRDSHGASGEWKERPDSASCFLTAQVPSHAPWINKQNNVLKGFSERVRLQKPLSAAQMTLGAPMLDSLLSVMTFKGHVQLRWLFSANLTRTRVTRESSAEDLSPSDWPVGKSLGHRLNG